MAVSGAARWFFFSAASLLAPARTASAEALLDFLPRNYSGVGNNIVFPSWGSTGITQVRAVAGADYADDGFTPPGGDRPTAREVMTNLFSSSTATLSTNSALFVAWGQLLTYDLSLTIDDVSEPFDIVCDDGGGMVDVWCPAGTDSDNISFHRSIAAMSNSVRNPVNHATSYIDLDYVYGRSEEEALEFRSLEGGFMNVTGTGVPFRNTDGTWMIPDQRTARFPVTFALHIMLLLEHNRCCLEVAPAHDYEGDEDLFQACRDWTIAIFQHMTEDDFIIQLLGDSIYTLGRGRNTTTTTTTGNRDTPSSDTLQDGRNGRRGRSLSSPRPFGDPLGVDGENSQLVGDAVGTKARRLGVSLEHALGGRGAVSSVAPDDEVSGTGGESVPVPDLPGRRLYSLEDYDDTVNPTADVFALTAGAAAFESSLPPTVRIVSKGYVSVDEDNVELIVASEDLAGLLERNSVGDILRGAVLSPALEVDTYYSAAVSNLSPLFKLPVDAVQRGRDHGLPTYNDARKAYGLTAAADFSDITGNAVVAALLSDAYGGDIDTVDAITGALAEDAHVTTGGVFGSLLFEAWVDQLFRTIAGDRLFHWHSRVMETVENTMLSDVINRTLHVTDLPMSVFVVPSVTVCAAGCETVGEADVTLSDSFGIAWQVLDEQTLSITLRAKDIGDAGMLAIGWGGHTMCTAQDFVICEVTSATGGECIDRSSVSTRTIPSPDMIGSYLNVTSVSIDGEWTSISFLRDLASLDHEDYDIAEDIEFEADTLVVYCYREGAGVGQHPNGNRGASTVNFATGATEIQCENRRNFASLHGALMLIAWMFVAPAGIYYIRYSKGHKVKWAGREWYEMHQELMILTSEGVLPLAITAIFVSEGDHTTNHAHWGYLMIVGVATQIFTGWIRTKGLKAKHPNFSVRHRFNKHFHIWAGRFAYISGVIQCYRGLELVSGDEDLIFSAVDGFDVQLGNFGTFKRYVFPTWAAAIAVLFIFLETRKQYDRFFAKRVPPFCACADIANETHETSGIDPASTRLMPRTEDLLVYSVSEFNVKVLNGQSWVLVDGAILDVSSFSQRHPGGARVILNAVGTNITQELLGEELSVGHAMSFSPRVHSKSAWEIVRTLVVGYIEEDSIDDGEYENEGNKGSRRAFGGALAGEGHAAFKKDARRTYVPTGRPLTVVGRKLSINHELMTTPAVASRDGSSRNLLELFHVCPLLFREKMEAPGGGSPGGPSSTRPVYRYIFCCPGEAQALVQAMTGVCVVNMRAQARGKGVTQRPYNAFAVRVQEPQTPSYSEGGSGRGGTGAGGRTIVPAGRTTEGMLCVEIRIKLQPDGTMSKLLEKLAKDTDNPAVQLQGPFVTRRLVPPPAHRNVVMIAAGTGINPMVQLMRDYLDLPRDPAHSWRSRLALVWQCTSEAELYGADEITAMQVESEGLLEVTTVISGDTRKRNVPGAASDDSTKRSLAGPTNRIWPAASSTRSSFSGYMSSGRAPTGRHPRIGSQLSGEGAIVSGSELMPATVEAGGVQGNETTGDGEGGGEDRIEAGLTLPPNQDPSRNDASARRRTQSARIGYGPSRRPVRQLTGPRRPSLVFSRPAGTHPSKPKKPMVGKRVSGTVTREVLDVVFGPDLLAELEMYGKQAAEGSGGGLTDVKSDGSGGADGADEPDALSGKHGVAGKLQVVASGPRDFVSDVERTLTEMGVPSTAMVLLD